MHHTLRSAAPAALAVALLAGLFTQAARAQAPCAAPGPDCAVVGKLNVSVGLGIGGRTNPVRGKSDLLLPLLPRISYYGKRFFVENLEVGVTLHEGKSNTFNLIAAPGYDRAFFYSSDLQNVFLPNTGTGGGYMIAMPEPLPESPETRDAPEDTQEIRVSRRRSTYLVGPEWTFVAGRVVGQLNWLREATGHHNGSEVRAALAAPIIDAKGSLVISTGLTWKSSELVRYYYGVEGLYEPGSAVNPFLKLGYSLPLSDRWGFSAFAHYEQLDGAITHSPIISGSGVATVFAGFILKVL